MLLVDEVDAVVSDAVIHFFLHKVHAKKEQRTCCGTGCSACRGAGCSACRCCLCCRYKYHLVSLRFPIEFFTILVTVVSVVVVVTGSKIVL